MFSYAPVFAIFTRTLLKYRRWHYIYFQMLHLRIIMAFHCLFVSINLRVLRDVTRDSSNYNVVCVYHTVYPKVSRACRHLGPPGVKLQNASLCECVSTVAFTTRNQRASLPRRSCFIFASENATRTWLTGLHRSRALLTSVAFSGIKFFCFHSCVSCDAPIQHCTYIACVCAIALTRSTPAAAALTASTCSFLNDDKPYILQACMRC